MNVGNVSIVVLSYNKINQTRQCIESILSSGYKTDIIHCLDNGSDKKVFENLKLEFPMIDIKRIEKNKGYSGGFNEAMKRVFSKGYKSTLFLTNDTLIFNDTLSEIFKTRDLTNARIIAPAIRYLYNSNIDSIGGYFDEKNCSLHHYKEFSGYEILNGERDYIPGTALWIEKSAFEELNGMDESYHTYWEDVDFSFRAREKKIILGKSEGANILHGVGKTCHKKPVYTTYYFQRNRMLFCDKFLKGQKRKYCLNLIHKELLEILEKFKNKKDKTRANYILKILNNFPKSK